MPTKSIITKTRGALKTIRSLGQPGTQFPDTIAPNSLIIHVYDTKNSDMVNAGLSASAKAVGGLIKSAFDELKSGSIPTNGSQGFGNKKLKKEYIDAFRLPFPNDISESLAHSYEAENGWADSIPTGGLATMAKGIGETVSAGVAKATGSQAYKYYENKIAMYQSSEARSIELTWTLLPYTDTEAGNLHEIIRKLKMYSSPSLLAQKLILKSPHFFKLEFRNKILNDKLQFTEVNITSISVAYSPGGNMELFHDDMPKSVELSITFADREPKTFEDWDNKGIEEVIGDHC